MGPIFFSALGKLSLSHLSQHIVPQINLASSSDTQKSCSHTKYQLLLCPPTTRRNFPKILAVKVMGNPELHKVPVRRRPTPQLQLILLTYSWLPPLHCRNKKLGLESQVIQLDLESLAKAWCPWEEQACIASCRETNTHICTEKCRAHTFQPGGAPSHPFVRGHCSAVQNLETAPR